MQAFQCPRCCARAAPAHQALKLPFSCSRREFLLSVPDRSACTALAAQATEVQQTSTGMHGVHRRAILAACTLMYAQVLTLPTGAAEAEQPGLVDFTNQRQGYHLRQPASWEQSSKAGADALFVDPRRKSSTLGVTVSPIRIDSLDKFGSLEMVRERLLSTERAKESTRSADLVAEKQWRGPSGTLIYAIEYELDSTRGRKHIFSTCAIANKKLYIANGTYKCEAESCAAGAQEIAQLQQAAQSLDVL